MRTALTLAFALAAGQAHAQFKCTQPDGSVAFQQAPCAAQARAEKLSLPPPPPDDGRGVYRAAAARGAVRIGMNRAEVDLAMGGPPEKVNRSMVGGRQHDQLVYKLSTGPAYLYLDDGVLSSWQYDPGK